MRIKSWRQYARLPLVGGLLTHEHEIWLGTRIQAGEHDADRAIADMVNANVRLVYSIARKYAVRGRDYDDLCSEGMLGLLNAAKRYDPSCGTRFTTYATYWVTRRINRSLIDTVSIRIPQDKHSHIMHILDSRRRFYQARGVLPTAADLIIQMRADIDRYPKSLQVRVGRMTTEIIDEYLACASIQQISLSDYVTESITHGDLISTGEDITDGADKIALRQALDDVIALLTPRDQLLMRLRFGLEDDGKEHTLAEIAERTGVSRERVRQIINVSLQRIGQSESARVLRETTER